MGESIIMVGGGWSYWLQWQVVICVLMMIILLPSVVAVFLAKIDQQPLNSADLWVPCWKNLNPLWLLFYRAFAFTSMAVILYQTVLFYGPISLYFYTQWSFALVMIYFGIATIISACGCWIYAKKPEDAVGSKVGLISGTKEFSDNDGKCQSRYNQQEELDQIAGFWESVMQTIYQTSAGAAILTDIVFWCLILPFLTDETFHINFLIGCTHTLNAILLILDSALNSMKFPYYRLPYFVLWSVIYIIFHWVLHACGSTWWPYPFLDLSTPWAPLWYFGLALVHVPCFGIYALLIKAKNSIFSSLFPDAFGRNSLNTLEKKHP